MGEYQLGSVEARFAQIIWECEPMTSKELVKKSEEILSWKKSTTYTVLKRLCDKGIFCNENGVVKSLITKEEFYSLQSEKFVKDTFGGSLPAFFAAFTRGKGITSEEAKTLRKMIEEYEEG